MRQVNAHAQHTRSYNPCQLRVQFLSQRHIVQGTIETSASEKYQAKGLQWLRNRLESGASAPTQFSEAKPVIISGPRGTGKKGLLYAALHKRRNVVLVSVRDMLQKEVMVRRSPEQSRDS